MKDETIKLLEGHKQTFIASRLYAEIRINYMEGGKTHNVNDPRQLEQMKQQKDRCEKKLTELDKCINWLQTLP